jgi:hypothetical protein
MVTISKLDVVIPRQYILIGVFSRYIVKPQYRLPSISRIFNNILDAGMYGRVKPAGLDKP